MLGGCAQPAAPQANPSPVAAEDYRRVFETAIESLRYHGFVIDRQDYRFGRITTKPRLSPQVFEVWNHDNSTLDQSLASTFNDQRRIASVKLDADAPGSATGDAAPPAAAYRLTVAVAIERSTNPNRRLTGSSDGFAVVEQLSATPDQYKRDGIAGRSYVNAGTDPQFEQKLLADIHARLRSDSAVDSKQ